LESQRSARGTLSSKIKNVMFQTFGEGELPLIKTTDYPSDIITWKEKKTVAECYEKLFQPANSDTDKCILQKIIEKIYPTEDDPPKVQVAFVIAVCTTILNPRNKRIQLNERIMKSKVAHYLVSFYNFVNCDKS
jgi:hypothetical protein